MQRGGCCASVRVQPETDTKNTNIWLCVCTESLFFCNFVPVLDGLWRLLHKERGLMPVVLQLNVRNLQAKNEVMSDDRVPVNVDYARKT